LNTPQLILTALGGLRLPLVDCIPRTNVAESADVLKNVPIRNTAMIVATVPNGSEENIPNIASSSANSVKPVLIPSSS
jgi:hypothetical protein